MISFYFSFFGVGGEGGACRGEAIVVAFLTDSSMKQVYLACPGHQRKYFISGCFVSAPGPHHEHT